MPAIIVKSLPRARYRAGFRFTREPDVYEVTAEQEAAIRADSMLVVAKEDKPAEPVLVPAPAPVPDEKGPRRKAER
jgi:hypothetical protein